MTKLDLQKELLEKVKLGIKPSDFKKEKINTPASSPPASPIIVPVDKKSQPKPELESISPPPIVQESQQIKDLKQQVNFHANQAQSYLANLQATMAQLDSAELTIKDLTRENKSLRENISQLKNQSKNPRNIQASEIKTPPELPEPKQYFFTCDICQQNKKSQLHLARVNGLGIDPNKQNKICNTCLRKVDIIQPQKEDFF